MTQDFWDVMDRVAIAFEFVGRCLLYLVAAAPILLMLWLTFKVHPAEGREQYPGQYAQVDPSIKKWFNEQKIPGTERLCCSEADGVFAEEDIRGNSYWTRFVAKQYNDGAPPTEISSGWMKVPDEAVILDPNRHGAPVVWWGWQNGLFIRCFSPGAKF